MPALLQLDRLSCVLPDGTPLFHQLQFSFTPHRIGLVGANGVGKSVLARLLAGEVLPASGAVRCDGSVRHVPQELSPEHFPCVAALAGVDGVLAALDRIAAGSIDEADYALVGERWDAGARLQQSLDEIGLGQLRPDTPTASLSGGERQRIALAGAWLSQADWLILDEPSNHLDATQRAGLERHIARWPRGLLLLAPASSVPNGKLMLELRGLVLPYGQAQPIDLILSGPRRLAVTGDNGSGKSTLLRVIAGRLAPRSGEVLCHGRLAWLDQHAASLDGELSAVQRLQARNPGMPEGELRTRLALLGIAGARATMASALLSGGERMKVALAAELYAQMPPQLLLLDEPDNHLDLSSLQALERMLAQYQGALLVVSHDQAFLQQLGLDQPRLHLAARAEKQVIVGIIH